MHHPTNNEVLSCKSTFESFVRRFQYLYVCSYILYIEFKRYPLVLTTDKVIINIYIGSAVLFPGTLVWPLHLGWIVCRINLSNRQPKWLGQRCQILFGEEAIQPIFILTIHHTPCLRVCVARWFAAEPNNFDVSGGIYHPVIRWPYRVSFLVHNVVAIVSREGAPVHHKSLDHVYESVIYVACASTSGCGLHLVCRFTSRNLIKIVGYCWGDTGEGRGGERSWKVPTGM